MKKIMENDIKFINLKRTSGSHSPSISEIVAEFPELDIKVDACFLSNPYATDLFLNYFKNDILISEKRLREVLEYYPSQNKSLSKEIANFIGVEESNVFTTNGATEGIKAIFDNLIIGGKLVVPIPTFSPYYEFAASEVMIDFYNLNKENEYCLDIEDFIDYVKIKGATSLCLINPNNPNGSYLAIEEIIYLLKELEFLDTIILDESFSHFVLKNEEIDTNVFYSLIKEFPNLIIVKSMSKDFGIAGIRAGYIVSSEMNIKKLKPVKHLWNLNGIAEYFFKTYLKPDFQIEYRRIRDYYNEILRGFKHDLAGISGLRVFPTYSNFVLVEILENRTGQDVFNRLLFDHGVYVRLCDDKVGLNGQFIRLACRSVEENKILIESLKHVLN